MKVTFRAWCDTMKVTMQTSDLYDRKTNMKGFRRKINYITENTVVDLDGAQEKGCVNPRGVCRKIRVQ